MNAFVRTNHLYSTTNYLYTYEYEEGRFKICNPLELKRGMRVKVYNSETGELLTGDLGETVFRLRKDYNGETRIPYFD